MKTLAKKMKRLFNHGAGQVWLHFFFATTSRQRMKIPPKELAPLFNHTQSQSRSNTLDTIVRESLHQIC